MTRGTHDRVVVFLMMSIATDRWRRVKRQGQVELSAHERSPSFCKMVSKARQSSKARCDWTRGTPMTWR